MSVIFANLWGRLIGRPLIVTPEGARQLTAYLMSRSNYGGGQIIENDAIHNITDLMAGVGNAKAMSDHTDQFYRVMDGVAIIPIRGTLVHRLGLNPYCGMTGYDGIARKVDQAVSDASVKGIMLEIDSPGGEVSGVLELGETIRAARDKKPVWAVADESAYSAAYWIGSQANRLLVPKTGGVGSIGVITMHADYSEHMKSEGVKVTIIAAGTHKSDGNPFEPLPEDVRSRVAADVEATRQLFAQEVVSGRPDLLIGDVLATEALCYSADQAVEIGLADAVQSSKSAMADFIEKLSVRTVIGPIQSKGASEMPPEINDRPDANDPGETVIPADDDKIAVAVAAAVAADRKRSVAIIGSKEAAGREGLASSLAFETDLSVDAAVAMLAKAPSAQSNPLSAAMESEPNSVIGDEPEPGKGPSKVEKFAANFAVISGRKLKG